MSVTILDSSAWREFRGIPGSKGINETTHLAKIADSAGNLHDCFVKLLPLHYPSLLGEAIGWLLAKASNVNCVPFAAIVIVPLSDLRKCMSLPSEFDGLEYCPAWSCEILAGKSVRQVHKWAYWLSRRRCLHSDEARKIAAFDLWTDLRDRNFGNVIRTTNGSYVSIDHETILHDLLWPPTGKFFHSRSLLDEARQHLSSTDFLRFKNEMVSAAHKHTAGLASSRPDLIDIIGKIYPALAPSISAEALRLLDERAQSDWIANKLGVLG